MFDIFSVVYILFIAHFLLSIHLKKKKVKTLLSNLMNNILDTKIFFPVSLKAAKIVIFSKYFKKHDMSREILCICNKKN